MKLRLVFALLLGAIANFAMANLTFVNTGAGQVVNITYNSSSRDVFAGKLNFMKGSSSLQLVCGDLDHFISGGQSWNCSEVIASAVSVAMGKAGSIVGQGFAGAISNDDCAGLQLAVWETVYDYGTNGLTPDFSNGNFKTNAGGSVLAAANSYYSLLANPDAQAIYYRPIPTDAGQGQLGPVPEPGSIVALAIGGLALLRRRKA